MAAFLGPGESVLLFPDSNEKANLPWKLLRQSHPGALSGTDAMSLYDLQASDLGGSRAAASVSSGGA